MRLKDLKPEPEMLDARARAYELAELLLNAFAWTDTHEGHEYWAEVHRNLTRISNSQTEPGEKF